MKKFRKILIILSLSFYISALFIPQKEKEAHAFVLTGSMVLGALAVAGMGGVVAYGNREAIQDLGNTVSQKLTDSGVNVGDMLSRNEYGMNNAMTNAIGESIIENKVIYGTEFFEIPFITLNAGEQIDINYPTSFTDKIMTYQNFAVEINIYTKSAFNIRDMHLGLRSSLNADYLNFGSYQVIPGEHYRETISSTSGLTDIKEYGQGIVSLLSNADYPVSFNITTELYKTTASRDYAETYNSLPAYDNTTQYSNELNTVYNGQTVSVDYNRIEDIMTNSASEPLTLTNIESIVSGLESSIVDAGADTVGILTTIWNGISNIPTLIQSSSTAVLGGISTLSDDLLTGLGTFTGNITQANQDLWTDAGLVWSGMTSAIENLGTDISTSVSTAITDGLTGIDTLVGDLGTVIGSLPDTISTSVTGALTGLGDIVTDLGTTVRAIPGAITTSTTDAFTSAFTVPDNYFTTRTTAIQEIIGPKLPQLPDKEALFPSQYQEMEDWAGISADFSHYGIGEQMVIGNTAPNYYRRQIKLWISAILYFFTALFVIRKIAGVINK